MSKKYGIVLFFIIFFFSTILNAQEEKGKIPLSELLIQLQDKYRYEFTYADDEIKDIYIQSPPGVLTFQEVLNYLNKETGLIFKSIGNTIVTIQKKPTTFYICGYILDNETRIPLANVAIIGKNHNTTSDVFGYFKLKIVPGKKKITIRHLGYNTLVRSVASFKGLTCTNIYLNQHIEALSEIVVANFMVKGIDRINDGTYIINFSNFGLLPGLIETDVLQTVQSLPGIQSINETISNINIRGGTNDQNLLLWDGIKMYQSGHFFGLISIFNPLITTDVSVIKNGTDVNFSDGVSGTIDMKTDAKINHTFKGSIGINMINADAFIDVPLGNKSSLQLSARKAINNLIETPTYNEYFDRISRNTAIKNSNIKFDFYDTSLRWLYKISEKDQIRINLINVSNNLEFGEKAGINQNEEFKESSIAQNSIAESLFYRRDWNNNFSTTLQLYETDYKLKAINSKILQQQRLFQENKVSETSVKLKTIYKANNKLSFLNGYQYTETGISNLTDVDNPVFKSFEREVIREHAGFSQIKYVSNLKKMTVKLGLRYSYIDKFRKHLVEPRFSFNQQIFKHLNVQVSGEFKHQNTSQIINLQNDFLGVEKRRWRLSNNKDIPIIKGKQVSFGLTYNSKGWLFSAEGYFKEVKGITSRSQGFLNQYTLARAIGSYQVNGVDFLINKRFKKMSSWLSYSYANNDYTFNDFAEINFPNNLDIKHSLTLGSSFSTNNFKVSAGLNWHTGRPITKLVAMNEVVDNIINYEQANSINLDNYLRIDLSATYKFKISNDVIAHTGVSVWNGLGKENKLNTYYRLENNLPVQIDQTSLGMTPNFTLRIEFR